MEKKETIILIIILLVALTIISINYNTKTNTYSWNGDSIQLMQHETEGTYGCFGCSQPGEGPAMCIDPIFEMKLVEETFERYCNLDFEVIEN